MRRTDGEYGEQGADPVPLSSTAGPAAAVAEAACGYWRRRGLPTQPRQVAVAPGAPLLLLALLATTEPGRGGGVLLPRPSAAWYAPQARLLARDLRTVPVSAESGGVPDPFALLETVRRARAEGVVPRVLVLSVADDPTGTATPPELLHEVCEAAVDEGLLIVSDETWRDTSHDPHDTVVISPAEMLGETHADSVVVLAGLGTALLPSGLYAGIARFPGTPHGHGLADSVREVLHALHTELSDPVATAAAEALTEPPGQRRRLRAETRVQGVLAAALHDAFTEAGAVCRPPRAGRHLYADWEQARTVLAGKGIRNAPALEAELVRHLGPHLSGGHRFEDDPHELRVRVSTEVLTSGLPRTGGRTGLRSLVETGADPREDPGVGAALERVRSVLGRLTAP